jgi:hypothetical protein
MQRIAGRIRVRHSHVRGIWRPVEAKSSEQQLAMLHILYGACSAALNAFRAADNPIDKQLVLDLEAMIARTQDEIDRLGAALASDAT